MTLQLLAYTRPEDFPTGPEQVAYDDQAQVAYAVGSKRISLIDLSASAFDPRSNAAAKSVPLLSKLDLNYTITDVQTCGDVVAVSTEGETKVQPGFVFIFSRYNRISGLRLSWQLLANFTVGALPDQIEFSRDCRTLLASNEGEPDGYNNPTKYTDPEGSVSVINLRYCFRGSKRPCNGNLVAGVVRTAGFSAWNGKAAELAQQGIKINGPNATVAQDLEPEYTTFAFNERVAFVSLQENNALAVLDVETATITRIVGLGLKDHSSISNPLDPSDRDNGIRIANWPVYGLYQPDEIKSFRDFARAADYVVMANEGDSRSDWPGFQEDRRVSQIISQLNPSVFPNASSTVGNSSALGRLTVVGDLNPLTDPNSDNKTDRLLAYGARSFTIYRVDGSTNNGNAVSGMTMVYDSAAELEQITARDYAALFNSEGVPASFDSRSDNKGPEPEGVAIGELRRAPPLASRRALFVGMERFSGVFVYDITDPEKPVYQSIALPPQLNPSDVKTRFTLPEGICFSTYLTPGIVRERVPLVFVAYEATAPGGGVGIYRLQ
eukprot:gene11909-12053_t